MQWLTNRFGERYLYEVNRNAFANENAAEVLNRHFGEQMFTADSLHIIVGTDSGLLVRYVLDKGIPEGSRYLFIEHPSLLPQIEARLEGLELGEAIKITTPDEWSQYIEPFFFTNYVYLGTARVSRSLGAIDAHFIKYAQMHWDLRRQIDKLTWNIITELGNRNFYQRQLENLAENRTDVTALKDSCQGSTAMILAGGPSLDEFIPWAKAHRDQLTLFAVSRISRRLIDQGLQPDVVVSVDPHLISFSVSREMLQLDPERVLFACSFHVSPLLLGQWSGRSVFFGDRLPWKSPLNNNANLQGTGPTVTNSALNLALYMGFSRVILAGVDLCHSRTGFSHAKGSLEHKAGPVLSEAGIKVKTNGGWMAETSPDLHSAIETLTVQAAMAEANGCEIINPAEASARIEKIIHRSIDDLSLEPPSRPFTEILAERLPEETPNRRTEYYQRCIKELTRVTVRLSNIRKLVERALECNDGLFGKNGKTADFKYKKRMDKIEKRLDREFKDLAPLVKQFDIKSFLRLTRPFQLDAEEWSDQELEEWGQAYYEAYRNGADTLGDLVKQARSRLESRIEEERDSPDISLLTGQWEQDKQFGRALVWQRQRERSGFPEDPMASRAMAPLKENFENIMTRDDAWAKHQLSRRRSLDGVTGKAWRLFRIQDIEGLSAMESSLKEMDSEEAGSLAALVSGYRHELEQATDSAMDAYQQIVLQNQSALSEDSPPDASRRWSAGILEDALLRISAIALEKNNGNDALLALDCLSAMSPAYEPRYAELLCLTGQFDKALDVYADYLEAVPDDTATLIQLGKLYRQLGAEDAAQQVFENVLQQEPDNKNARQLLEESGQATRNQSTGS